MSKPSITIDSKQLEKLHQQVQQAEIKDRQTLFRDFLVTVKQMVSDQAALHLPKSLDEKQRLTITQPQVFLSYAWEANGTPKLEHLHTFLKQLTRPIGRSGTDAVARSPTHDGRPRGADARRDSNKYSLLQFIARYYRSHSGMVKMRIAGFL